jgi:hypothetical protein
MLDDDEAAPPSLASSSAPFSSSPLMHSTPVPVDPPTLTIVHTLAELHLKHYRKFGWTLFPPTSASEHLCAFLATLLEIPLPHQQALP